MALMLVPHFNFFYYKEEVKEGKKTEKIGKRIVLLPIRLAVKPIFFLKKLWNKFKDSKVFLALKEGWDEEAKAAKK